MPLKLVPSNFDSLLINGIKVCYPYNPPISREGFNIMVGVEGDEIRLISYELFVYIDIFSNSENIKWKNMLKLPYKIHPITKHQTLYLFNPWVIVLYLSINLYSSRRNCCGETFLTTETVKLSKENWSPCTSLACIDSADLSHFPSSQKQLRWPLVRSWDFWVVRPK